MPVKLVLPNLAIQGIAVDAKNRCGISATRDSNFSFTTFVLELRRMFTAAATIAPARGSRLKTSLSFHMESLRQ
jgi:hypothetical protein